MGRRTKAEWEELLKNYSSSGMSLEEWSRKHDVDIEMFRNRLKKKSHKHNEEERPDISTAQSVNWIEVRMEKEETNKIPMETIPAKTTEAKETDVNPAASAISVVIGKININVRAGFDEAVLKSVCKVVMTI